ncbi:MAG: penicillin-binding protein 2 [Dehalococcoidia bacterium]|nr:penicillin-binding protein 2 [Dehalococcoidia bacterium]
MFGGYKRWRSSRKKRLKPATILKIRFAVFRVFIVLLFAILSGQLWKMQIVEGKNYKQKAELNSVRLLTVPSPRGVVYDRNKTLLVRNIPSFTVSVVPADLPKSDQPAVIGRLSKLLNTPPEDIANAIEDRRRELRLFTPIPIKTNVDQKTAFTVEEQHPLLPGVILQIEPIRQYIDGPLTAHLLGYVGRISEDELAKLESAGYDLNDRLGKAGIEGSFETELRGKTGRENVVVDVSGRKVEVLKSEPPTSGNNLVLTIDLNLQRKMAEYLAQEMGPSTSAAAVAINPKTGEILGMVSLPTFDNNLFSGGISNDNLSKLLNDPNRPLINHAIAGQYPSGSIFKVITGAAALQEGVIKASSTVYCAGSITVGGWTYPCWAPHGAVNILKALAVSCDVFFFSMGGGNQSLAGLGIDRLARYARDFGLGARTGIAIPGEVAGLVPDPQWKLDLRKEPWLAGETYNLSIGQGDLNVTPLQMANVVAAIANGGTLYRPQIVREILDSDGSIVRPFEKQVIRDVAVSKPNLATIRQGMLEATGPSGTANTFLVPGVKVGAKTGTAESGRKDSSGRPIYHGWFITFAPFDDPQIALLVFHSDGQGALTAAPAANKILRYFFGKEEPPKQQAPGS